MNHYAHDMATVGAHSPGSKRAVIGHKKAGDAAGFL
jgi:hypothetical protein